MSSSTKVRRLARLLEQDTSVVWAINHEDELVFLSAGCSNWLGMAGETLIGRRSKAGTPVSDDPADLVAASLSPPPGLERRGTASLRIQPPIVAGKRPDSKEVRYIRVGPVESGFTLGVAGTFNDRQIEPELQDAVAIRNRLDQWRQRLSGLGSVLLIGNSQAAERLRRRVEVASSLRTHVGFYQPNGGGAELLAMHIHQLSSSAEPFVQVDGPLMDAELLDATLMPLLNRLSDSESTLGTILCKQLDETEIATQQRLHSLLTSFPGRLRLLAICGSKEEEAATVSKHSSSELDDQKRVCDELEDILDTIQIRCTPLATRVEDLHAIAAALLGRYGIKSKITAERISRPALDALIHYPWPNNFAELEEAIRHASDTATGETVRLEDLPLSIRSYRPPTPQTTKKPRSLDDQVRNYEESLLREAMKNADGNRAEAARQLGISRSRLLRKLQQMPIDDSGTKGEG